MVSVKIVLAKHKRKKDNTIPIAIRIIKNRKPSYIWTGEYILEKDWNDDEKTARKSHRNSTRLNNFLQKKLSEAHATLLETEASNDNLTTEEIKKELKGQRVQPCFFN